jgi:PGF-CTERM protein
LLTTPIDKNSTWDYSYRTEVNDLEIGASYTAVIIIKEFGFDDWKGVWWWNNIETDGQQYDHAFSLPRGCYSISASLYESQDLNSDVKNASVLSDVTFEFVIGTGTCNDGLYSEEIIQNNGSEDTNSDIKDIDDDSVPGFGIALCLLGIVGALFIVTRRT